MNINATLFLQAIVFAILVWFTMKFVWPPITKALDERALKIADGLAAADKAKAELSTANKRVEDELSSRVLTLRRVWQMLSAEDSPLWKRPKPKPPTKRTKSSPLHKPKPNNK